MPHNPGASDARSGLDIEAIIARYHRASVRDLAWLIMSPPLFAETLGRFPAFNPLLKLPQTLAWFTRLDNTALEQKFPQRQHYRRLGLYCEALFEYFFRNSEQYDTSDYSFIARNLQYQDQGVTLGELDFLLRNRRNHKVYHVELAVKFFLQAQANDQQWSQWIGPNAKDRLDIKLNRMIDHQLALPHKAQTITEALAKHYAFDSPLQSYHFIKGALFAHPKSSVNKALPLQCALQNASGKWLRLQELHRCRPGRYHLCDKMEWLTPTITWLNKSSSHESKMMNQGEEITALSLNELTQSIEALHSRSRAQFKGGVPGAMIVNIDTAGTSDNDPSHHCAPHMIVPGYWPSNKAPSRKI